MNFGNYCLLLAVSLGLCQDLLSPFSTGKDGLVSTMEDLDFRNSSSSSSVAVATVVHPSTRRRRDIFHLYNMMTCVTGCDPLRYKGYGCYCGFLGSGAPMDGIDRCCKMHDLCYGAAVCHQSVTYFVPYKWRCNRGRPQCVTGPGRPRNQQLCSLHLCECDRQFAECISRYPCPDRKLTCASNPLRNVG